MNLKLYRGAAALNNQPGQSELVVFFETAAQDPGYELGMLLSQIWNVPPRDVDVQLVCSAEYVLKHWCTGDDVTGDARLFELGFDAEGVVNYVAPERTLFLVTPNTLQRLVIAQRGASELAAAGYRPPPPAAAHGRAQAAGAARRGPGMTDATPTPGQLVDAVMTAIHSAETRAIDLQVRLPGLRTMPSGAIPFGALDDHRTAVAGDLAEALDAFGAGLGMRFMQALHPELDLSPREGEPL